MKAKEILNKIKDKISFKLVSISMIVLLGLSLLILAFVKAPIFKGTKAKNQPFYAEKENPESQESQFHLEIATQINKTVEQILAKNSTNNATGSIGSASTDPTSGYPETILQCTRDGNDLLVLVNKQYQLPATYAPADLVPTSNSGIRVTQGYLYSRNVLINDLSELNSAAQAAGIDIAVLSAYRSYETQQSTYNYWVSTLGQAEADRVSARAGHSQHQLGTALDFTTSEIGDALGTQFANTQAGIWLAENAWKYGFVIAYPYGYESTTGYSYEPWHFRYIGKENAASWKNSSQILETWLQGQN
ncbi:M15 family metallopeptidase [Candidatus Dojkabacteria bacterium]|nr:M15 family metallopeptidase [Candidatus Dojkabacteria bacterium]